MIPQEEIEVLRIDTYLGTVDNTLPIIDLPSPSTHRLTCTSYAISPSGPRGAIVVSYPHVFFYPNDGSNFVPLESISAEYESGWAIGTKDNQLFYGGSLVTSTGNLYVI